MRALELFGALRCSAQFLIAGILYNFASHDFTSKLVAGCVRGAAAGSGGASGTRREAQASNYVNDFAGVLDQSTTAQMNEICQQIDEKAHAQIAVVTVHTLDGADIESYAVNLFHQWGVGSKSTDRGVLILYAIDDRHARIEVGYGLEAILPDGKVGGFQREAIPLMRSGDYSKALLLVTDRVAEVIAQDAECNSRRNM